MQSRWKSLPPAVRDPLGPDGLAGIVGYTFDLGTMSEDPNGGDNLFAVLNASLHVRAKELSLPNTKAFLYHLLRGLAALPPFQGVVYRGIPATHAAKVCEEYTKGTDVYWSAFTSTTMDVAVAKQFAGGPGGVIFIIDVLNLARAIQPYSAIQTENEVLLSPNSKFVVFEGSFAFQEFIGIKMVETKGAVFF